MFFDFDEDLEDEDSLIKRKEEHDYFITDIISKIIMIGILGIIVLCLKVF